MHAISKEREAGEHKFGASLPTNKKIGTESRVTGGGLWARGEEKQKCPTVLDHGRMRSRAREGDGAFFWRDVKVTEDRKRGLRDKRGRMETRGLNVDRTYVKENLLVYQGLCNPTHKRNEGTEENDDRQSAKA